MDRAKQKPDKISLGTELFEQKIDLSKPALVNFGPPGARLALKRFPIYKKPPGTRARDSGSVGERWRERKTNSFLCRQQT